MAKPLEFHQDAQERFESGLRAVLAISPEKLSRRMASKEIKEVAKRDVETIRKDLQSR